MPRASPILGWSLKMSSPGVNMTQPNPPRRGRVDQVLAKNELPGPKDLMRGLVRNLQVSTVSFRRETTRDL
jgi:hypothetical protein